MPTTPVLPAAPDAGQLLSVAARPGDRPGRVVVEVTGRVDACTAPLLQLCLDSRTDQRDVRELVVDLEQVTSFGADGVAALVRAHRRCVERGIRLVLRWASRRRVLHPRRLTGLADLIGADTVEQARPRPGARRTAAHGRATPAVRDC